jgi:hypothetical protein
MFSIAQMCYFIKWLVDSGQWLGAGAAAGGLVAKDESLEGPEEGDDVVGL